MASEHHYPTWRAHLAPIIAEVLQATRGQPERDIRRALREAYPSGAKRGWPYKVWRDEVRRQRRPVRAITEDFATDLFPEDDE